MYKESKGPGGGGYYQEFENLGEVGEYVPEFASKLNFEGTIWILSQLCNIKSRKFCEVDNS